MSCENGCICRERRQPTIPTPLDVLEPTPLCTAKPGECACFEPESDIVVIRMSRDDAECIAAAAGDFAFIPSDLGPAIDEQLRAQR